jgi:hypothetical protein
MRVPRTTLLAAVLGLSLGVPAQAQHVTVGIATGADLTPTQDLAQSVELLAHYFVSPTSSLDFSVGTHSYSEGYAGGRSGTHYSLRQYPVRFGGSLLTSRAKSLQFAASAGIAVAPTTLEWSGYTYPRPVETGSSSSVVIGGYAGVGMLGRLSRALDYELSVRYHINPADDSHLYYASSTNYWQLRASLAIHL